MWNAAYVFVALFYNQWTPCASLALINQHVVHKNIIGTMYFLSENSVSWEWSNSFKHHLFFQKTWQWSINWWEQGKITYRDWTKTYFVSNCFIYPAVLWYIILRLIYTISSKHISAFLFKLSFKTTYLLTLINNSYRNNHIYNYQKLFMFFLW